MSSSQAIQAGCTSTIPLEPTWNYTVLAFSKGTLPAQCVADDPATCICPAQSYKTICALVAVCGNGPSYPLSSALITFNSAWLAQSDSVYQFGIGMGNFFIPVNLWNFANGYTITADLPSQLWIGGAVSIPFADAPLVFIQVQAGMTLGTGPVLQQYWSQSNISEADVVSAILSEQGRCARA